MRRVHPDFRVATRLLGEREASQALAIAEALVASDDVEDRLDGYMCRAFVYEDGGKGVQIDLVRSMNDFRQASILSPGAITYLNLARIALKRKRFSESLKFLELSASYEVSPELMLGYGHYFEECEPMDAVRAKKYFFQAAGYGRFAGFFGYSRVARKAGQHFRALGMDCTRVSLGWLIALAIGARAQFKF